MPRPKKQTPRAAGNDAVRAAMVEVAKPPVHPVAPPPPSRIVTNCVKGTRLSVGDGQILEYGESAETSDELAAFLRERGQVE